MSDGRTKQNTPSNYLATLVHGRIYVLGDMSFYADEPRVVSASQKAILDEDAVDSAKQTIGGGEVKAIPLPKFKFEPLEDGEVIKVKKETEKKAAENNKKRSQSKNKTAKS